MLRFVESYNICRMELGRNSNSAWLINQMEKRKCKKKKVRKPLSVLNGALLKDIHCEERHRCFQSHFREKAFAAHSIKPTL